MSVRPEVADLLLLGPFPAEDADEAVIVRYQTAIEKIKRPISDEEAGLLLGLFGPDDCYGGAWALLHLIESAPHGAPLTSQPLDTDNEWLRRLWARAHRVAKPKPVA